jgi:hypothetical protein
MWNARGAVIARNLNSRMITIGKTASASLQFGQLSPVLSAFDQFGADTSQTTSG